MSISYTELYDKVSAMIKPSRFEHSIGVAECAESLARRFSLSPEDARYCGIYHDAYRYVSGDVYIEMCLNSAWKIYPEELQEKNLLHGIVAAIKFPEDAKGVPYSFQLAVRHHTLGSVEMGKLGALIYIADYIEPGRKHLGEEERRAILSHATLEGMIVAIMDMQREYFSKVGIKEADVSRKLYDFCSSGGVLA